MLGVRYVALFGRVYRRPSVIAPGTVGITPKASIGEVSTVAAMRCLWQMFPIQEALV